MPGVATITHASPLSMGMGRAPLLSAARRVRHTLTGLASLAAIAAVPVSASASDPYRTYVDDFEERLDAAFQTGDFVGLAVAVVHRGDLVSMRVYGDTSLVNGDPVEASTVFRLASVSKGFSTTLIGQLAEEGRLEWGDQLTEYAPNFRLKTKAATNAVTLERLASHQVGLPGYAYDNWLEHGEAVPRILERTAKLDLVCQPGNCYGYQNVTFSLLADTVEAVEGRDFDEVMDERVFEPLGMYHASLGRDGLLSSSSWARPHKRRSSRSAWTPFTPDENYYRVAAAGGLNASIDDMVQWVRAQLGHEPRVVSRQVLRDVHGERVDTPNEFARMRWMRGRLRDADYALGWRVYDYAGERLVYHAGGVAGYRAVVAMLPERDLGMVALWNTSTSRGWRIMPTLLDAYLGLPEQDWLRVSPILAAREGGAQGSP